MVKVTVLMPTYNVAPYVKEAVESVLTQTYRDFLLLVIDDCSTDATVEAVRSFDDPRLRIVQNECNLGLAENLNRGLSLVATEYVARMDGDDIAEPCWLEHEVAVLDAHPNIGICGAGFERFGTAETQVRFPKRHEDIVANMLFECSVIVPTFLPKTIASGPNVCASLEYTTFRKPSSTTACIPPRYVLPDATSSNTKWPRCAVSCWSG